MLTPAVQTESQKEVLERREIDKLVATRFSLVLEIWDILNQRQTYKLQKNPHGWLFHCNGNSNYFCPFRASFCRDICRLRTKIVCSTNVSASWELNRSSKK